MAAELVGGALLSASLQVLFEKMASPEVVEYLSGKKSSGLDVLLRKLKIKLSSVSAVLDDAEYKQIRSQGVKNWLDELQDAVFDAEDLLAEIEADALWLKMEPESSTGLSKVSKFISSIYDSTDRERKARIEEILERLEDIAREKDILGLEKLVVRENSSWRLPSTSLVEESGVYGRDDDKEVIIKLLLSNDEGSDKIGVIPIVGMGGIGKTTLAQLVYNDDEVKKRFELMAWVCVSEEFNVSRVMKAVLQSVSSTSSNDVTDLNALQVKLKEGLKGQKFLIVLDDVWNESYVDWDVMRMPLKDGAQGSKIVVTTRSEKVASIMGSVSSHHVKVLSKEASWELFAKHASGNGDFTASSKLAEIGREIVKKCNGLPLALKTLGGLLRSTLDVKAWDKILKSDIWDFTDEQSKILPALRLSYHYLPSPLKRCFAYCSIFPKGYEFEKEDLILLWMAENLLEQPNRSRRMEEAGDDYFNDLVSRSFFQSRHNHEGDSCFVMHDLIVDLAKSVSGKYHFLLDDDNTNKIEMMKQTRHLVYAMRGSDSSKLSNFVSEATRLRTINIQSKFSLPENVVHDLFFRMGCVRVLSLPYRFWGKELPNSIDEQRHLRYLNLSGTSIRRLPDSLSKLYNLQTLKLADCHFLTELPNDFHRLVNLRYLDVNESSLVRMPSQMSKLKSLQKLSTFLVGKDDGTKIGELGELADLMGKLDIRNLQNVVEAEDALEAKLSDKHLEELGLTWVDHYETGSSEHERGVLDNLLPNTTLKKLKISNYRGTMFPNWLVNQSFYNVVHVSLCNCKYCYTLPPLGQLSSLKSLLISGFDALVRVGPEFCGNSSSSVTPFASLENLEFWGMPNWEEWLMPNEAFQKLRRLSISACEKLNVCNMIESFGCLESLDISKYLNLTACRISSASLKRLTFSFCNNLEYHLLASYACPNLTELEFFTCNIVITSTMSWNLQLQGIPNLTTFKIDRCKFENNLESFPAEGMLPSTITTLEMNGLEWLKTLDSNGLQQLASLTSLFIRNCHNLRTITEPELPSSLQKLELYECPLLKEKCQRERGEYWNKIAHIPSITIDFKCSRSVLHLSFMLMINNVQSAQLVFLLSDAHWRRFYVKVYEIGVARLHALADHNASCNCLSSRVRKIKVLIKLCITSIRQVKRIGLLLSSVASTTRLQTAGFEATSDSKYRTVNFAILIFFSSLSIMQDTYLLLEDARSKHLKPRTVMYKKNRSDQNE